jgi:hypothetical protein
MFERPPSSTTEAQNDLEAMMQKVSLGISLVSLGLMVIGFVDMLVNGTSLSMPGVSTPSPLMLMSWPKVPASLVAMSVGIVLLALLPTVRVLLALWLYIHRREMLNSLVALTVFLELLLSVRTGG